MTDTTKTVHQMVLNCGCSKPSMCMCYSKCVTHLENAIEISLWVKGDRVGIDNQQLGQPAGDRQSYYANVLSELHACVSYVQLRGVYVKFS